MSRALFLDNLSRNSCIRKLPLPQFAVIPMLSRNHLSFALSLCRDGRGRPPFVVAGSKETRNEFRRFMAAFPDRYDYTKAQVRGGGGAGGGGGCQEFK